MVSTNIYASSAPSCAATLIIWIKTFDTYIGDSSCKPRQLRTFTDTTAKFGAIPQVSWDTSYSLPQLLRKHIIRPHWISIFSAILLAHLWLFDWLNK